MVIYNPSLDPGIRHRHSFGASHCPVKGCVMEDDRGTIKTVDAGKDGTRQIDILQIISRCAILLKGELA